MTTTPTSDVAVNDLGILWEDPPPMPPSGAGAQRRYARIVEVLAQHPGQWARVATSAKRDSAASITANGRAGRWAGVDAGSVEVRYGLLDDGQWGVYARVPADGEAT